MRCHSRVCVCVCFFSLWIMWGCMLSCYHACISGSFSNAPTNIKLYPSAFIFANCMHRNHSTFYDTFQKQQSSSLALCFSSHFSLLSISDILSQVHIPVEALRVERGRHKTRLEVSIYKRSTSDMAFLKRV